MQIATHGKEEKIMQQNEESCISPSNVSYYYSNKKQGRDVLMLARALGTCLKLV